MTDDERKSAMTAARERFDALAHELEDEHGAAASPEIMGAMVIALALYLVRWAKPGHEQSCLDIAVQTLRGAVPLAMVQRAGGLAAVASQGEA